MSNKHGLKTKNNNFQYSNSKHLSNTHFKYHDKKTDQQVIL